MENRFYETITELWAQALYPFVPGPVTPRAVENWNRRAASYDDTVPGGQKKAQACLQALSTSGLLENCHTAIEYGSATGKLAVLLAPFLKSYHCVDISEEMNRLAENRCMEQGLRNVTSECCDFWNCQERKFDLVIASYNPAVYCGEAVRRMTEQASVGGMYVCSCGPRKNELRDELCRELGIPGNIQNNNDVIYPYSILQALGMDPVLNIVPAELETVMTSCEAERFWISFLKGRDAFAKEQQEIVRRHVERHLNTSGKYVYRISECHGIIIWHKKKFA